MRRTNLIDHAPVEAAAPTMFGWLRPRRSSSTSAGPDRPPSLEVASSSSMSQMRLEARATERSPSSFQDPFSRPEVMLSLRKTRGLEAPPERERFLCARRRERRTALAGRLLPASFRSGTRAPGSKAPPRRTTEPAAAQLRRRSRVEEQASGIDKIVRGRSRGRDRETTGRRARRCIDLRDRGVDGGANCGRTTLLVKERCEVSLPPCA